MPLFQWKSTNKTGGNRIFSWQGDFMSPRGSFGGLALLRFERAKECSKCGRKPGKCKCSTEDASLPSGGGSFLVEREVTDGIKGDRDAGRTAGGFPDGSGDEWGSIPQDDVDAMSAPDSWTAQNRTKFGE